MAGSVVVPDLEITMQAEDLVFKISSNSLR